jgi:hypothetical protein
MKARFEYLWLPPEYSTVDEVREDPLGLQNDEVASYKRRLVLFSLDFCSIASKGPLDFRLIFVTSRQKGP